MKPKKPSTRSARTATRPQPPRRGKKSAEPVDATAEVDEFVGRLKHPLKAEIEAVRAIIRQANPKLGERVKWNAPSFFFRRDMAAFNLHRQEFVQLVFVFHDGRMLAERYGLLEGDYADRRLARFDNLADVQAKRAALERVVNAWVALMET